MSSPLVLHPDQVTVTVEPHEPEPVELGQWYWVTDRDPQSGSTWEWFGCVTRVGSNYVQLTQVTGSYERVHADEFEGRCRREVDPQKVIQSHVATERDTVRRLMGEVQAITARLGVGQQIALSAGSEGAALARLDANTDVGEYKTALVRAKEEELPELFRKIEKSHEELARWMKAEVLPYEAQLRQTKEVIERIDDRIFNVELYAGLTERVTRIADGEPAPLSEKIRIIQRRCYMDEECLAQYETGGMQFKDIGAFDKWIARTANRDRLLPFPRCIVAFQVRRHDKQIREFRSLVQFFDEIEEGRADKYTFLYIRNGERLYRMSTKLEFGAELFPDSRHRPATSGAKLWAKVYSGGTVDEIITEAQFQGLIEEYEKEKAEHQVERDAHAVELREWRERKRAAKEAGEEFDEDQPWLPSFSSRDPRSEYDQFEPDKNVYYDDIKKKIAGEIQESNRIAIIIQGLLDRSPVLHPHPPWRIWTPEGFELALELIYDSSRAFVAGAKPDFEAYRARLNASIEVGTITVGQEDLWDEQTKDVYDYQGRLVAKRRNYGDHGPGGMARVAAVGKRTKLCTFAWHREAQSRDSYGKKIRMTFECPMDKLLNVEAYKPGDFKRFFSDPRTRADYLQWAPLLLEAEEFHAGNRKPPKDPPPPERRESSWEGREKYRRKKEREMYLNQAVRLRRKVTTKGGIEHEKGTLWRVGRGWDRGTLSISRIDETGRHVDNGGFVTGMRPSDLVLVDPPLPDPGDSE